MNMLCNAAVFISTYLGVHVINLNVLMSNNFLFMKLSLSNCRTFTIHIFIKAIFILNICATNLICLKGCICVLMGKLPELIVILRYLFSSLPFIKVNKNHLLSKKDFY